MPRRFHACILPLGLAAACASAGPERASEPWSPGPAAERVAARAGADPSVFGGLWTVESPPSEDWLYRYGRSPDAEWLGRVGESAVRLGDYCSGVLVSEDGLVLTTQSCVRECISATSSGRDDLVGGVVARSAAEERLCPGLHVDRLLDVRDITQDVEARVEAGPPDVLESARADAIARLEKECAEDGIVCEAAPLWNGARIRLYRYRRASSVKLVLATEAAVAGADVLAWPRHALDFAVLRVYDDAGRRALRTRGHLDLRLDPPAEEEPVWVVSNPISTWRLASLAQLWYEGAIRHPQNVRLLQGVGQLLELLADRDESPQAFRDELYNVRGSLAQMRAQLAALEDSAVVGARLAWEREVRRRVAADPDLAERFGDVWDSLASIEERKAVISPRLNASNIRLVGSPHLMYGVDLHRATQDRRDGNEGRREMFLREDTDIDPDVARGFLGLHVRLIATWIDPDDPIRTSLLRPGESADDALERLLADTRLLDAKTRRRLLAGGATAVAASEDPLLHHAVVVDSIHDVLQGQWTLLLDREARERRRLAAATLAVYGESRVAPDATFSLRVADGVVRGDDVASLPAYTTFYGLYERAAVWPDRELPTSFVRRRNALDLGTPLNFAITADAFGSGGAVVDAEGRLTGIVIGTNEAHVANRFAFVEPRGRAIAVHTAAIVAALSDIYRADRVLRSLEIVKGKQ